MKGRGLLVVVLVLVLMAASVVPAGAAADLDGGGSSGFGGGLVAVGPGGFSDVGEGSVHAPAVGVLAGLGVFDGTECGEGLFCPDEPLQRSTMAVWLVRMVDGADAAPAASGVFSDVDYTQGYAPFADRLSELGVTRGCATGPLRYCPDRSVTRGQMAAFLVRAFGLEAGSAAGFTDVGTGHTFADDIDALAASRVTAGCSARPLRFCPDRNVTRAQMATFLARAAGLVELPAPVGAEPEEMPVPVFDPFTTPTLSDIDLERLGAAVATLDPEADCPPTVAPALLDDVAEVVQISGGCLNVEYVPLEGRTIGQVREAFASDPRIHAVGAPVWQVWLTQVGTYSNDAESGEQWHLPKLEAKQLWQSWPQGANVVVAVIDSGVERSHRELEHSVMGGVGGDCHVEDSSGHGTHVAGIIAAAVDNTHNVAGIAPNVNILPIRVYTDKGAFPCGDIKSMASAVNRAIRFEADVINMSLEWRYKGEGIGGPQDPFEAVVRAAMMRDIVVVAGAGNCGDPDYLSGSCAGLVNRTLAPGMYSGVISVAATNRSDNRARFSTSNTHVGIAAPGGSALGTFDGQVRHLTWDDFDSDGKIDGGEHVTEDDILSTVPRDCTLGFACTYTGTKFGTSMAAPMVSAVVAHMKARYPRASVSEIRRSLYETAHNPTSPGGWNSEYGWGIVRPLDAIERLGDLFRSCPDRPDSRGLLAYQVGIDIDADADDVHDSRVPLVDRYDIWTMDAATGQSRCRRAHNAWQPAWSPDGTRLAFVHKQFPDDDNEIWVMNADGTNWRNLTDNNSADYQPAWSPDGTKIAYVSNQSGNNDIWVMNGDGTGHRNLTNHASFDSLPAWSPDGTRIAFSSKPDGGDFDIWVMNHDGTAAHNLHDNNDDELRPTWSPDGTQIAFVHNPDEPGQTDDDIWAMDTDGTNWENLTNNDGEDIDPAWSPDGTRIAFASDRGGNNDIWVMRRDGTNPRNLTNTADQHETQPAWSPPKEPDPDDRQIRISWGSDATSRPDCPTGETCLYLQYEYIGSWDPAPYALECWTGNNRAWTGTWAGQPERGCYYWGEPAHVVIDGIRSNTINWTPPDDRQIRISWGSDATSRPDCPTGETCLYLQYEYIGSWDPAPYALECWTGNNRAWTGTWAGQPERGCYYWGEPAHVVIDGIRSNTINWTPPDDRQIRISWGSDATSRPDCPTGETCLYLQYEYIGTWDPAPYALECWTGNNRAWTGTWAGQPERGCYYWGEPAHVVIDGIRSNTITWPTQPTQTSGAFTAVTAGSFHSCGLRTDGTITCWGSNYHGETDPPPGTYTAITAGSEHSCGLRTDGTITCWGSNYHGETDPPPGTFTTITAGAAFDDTGAHSCGLRTDGTTTCWGSNEHGQTNTPPGTFTAITAGAGHSCGLRTDGTTTCWGSNEHGQTNTPPGTFTAITAGTLHSCGLRTDGTTTCWGNNSFAQADPPPGKTFTALTGSWQYSCGLETNGTITCWGSNYHGETDPPPGTFTAITAGTLHSCGLRSDGTITCWGNNSYAQADPPPGKTFTALTGSWQYSCGLETNGTITCWGWNYHGETGPPPGTFTAISAGSGHSCGLRTDRTITCWGQNYHGETDPPPGTFTAVAVGYFHSCGLRTDGTINCWGWNTSGQTDPPPGTFTAITSGGARYGDSLSGHSCGLRTDGTISCWGSNEYGQTNTPSGTFTAVTAGGVHSCGLRTDGTISCWGHNEIGQTNTPPGTFTAVAAGYFHSCGLRTDGTISCWGSNEFGEADTPGTFTAVAAGYFHSCGLRTDGTISCWGLNAITTAEPSG